MENVRSPHEFARFEALREVTKKVQVLRDMTQRLLVNSYRIFGVACFLTLQCPSKQKKKYFFFSGIEKLSYSRRLEFSHKLFANSSQRKTQVLKEEGC